MRQVSDYTDAELIKIGKKTVESNIKSAETTKAKTDIFNKLYAAYQAGDIEVPGLPKVKKD
ncbi:hypothetical protein LCGC14_2465270 [marine sediment metagenome]|uniref:Uncharacterized protein n=1 Tax=marine sediment metagenome TaxID=412755 RepID=A0A0F9BZS1_9ZZZZ